jgi:amino-acid N-acetyltransferase
MTDDSSQNVKLFRQALPYINAYRGKVFVILLPGEALANANFSNIAHDITLLNSIGVKLVLVHGARPQIDAAMKTAGLNDEKHDDVHAQLHHQLRVTDAASLEEIKKVVGNLRINIEAKFSADLPNSPMHGADISTVSGNYVSAKPFGVHNGVDYQHTGEVRKVDSDEITRLLDAGKTVLQSNLGFSPSGEVFNLKVEEIAASIAIALTADKLLIYSAESGILDNDGKAISQLNAEDAQALVQEKIASNGMDQQLLNLELATKACKGGVKRAQVISYSEEGALLTELFTRDGTGTLITQENYELLRDASTDDVDSILELIKPLEEDGVLVERSKDLLENEIEKFSVIEREGMIIACGSLYPQEGGSGELACLITHPDYRNNNLGQTVLDHIEKNARKEKLKSLFVLTTKTPHWFQERGFEERSIENLPDSKKSLYNYQRNSKIFVKTL